MGKNFWHTTVKLTTTSGIPFAVCHDSFELKSDEKLVKTAVTEMKIKGFSVDFSKDIIVTKQVWNTETYFFFN